MARSKGDTSPNKTKPNTSIQTTLFSQGSSVSSLQESPFVDPPKRAHALTVGAQEDDSDDERNDANKDGDDVSAGNVLRTSSDIDALRASIWHYPEFITQTTIPYIGRSGEEKVKFGWRCNFCKKEFKERNATKVICHLAGESGQHIAVCKGAIPEKYLKIIMERNRKRLKKHSTNSRYYNTIF